MKIYLRGRPKKYSFTRVTCLDSIMVETINCTPDLTRLLTPEMIENLRLSGATQFMHTFCHGASLMVGTAKNEFFIYCNLADGSDGLAAIEELKMLDALRNAKKHFLAMKKLCYSPLLENYTLRVTRF